MSVQVLCVAPKKGTEMVKCCVVSQRTGQRRAFYIYVLSVSTLRMVLWTVHPARQRDRVRRYGKVQPRFASLKRRRGLALQSSEFLARIALRLCSKVSIHS